MGCCLRAALQLRQKDAASGGYSRLMWATQAPYKIRDRERRGEGAGAGEERSLHTCAAPPAGVHAGNEVVNATQSVT